MSLRNLTLCLALAVSFGAVAVGPVRAEALYVGYLNIVRPTGVHERHAIGGTERGVSLSDCTRINAEWWTKAGPRLKAANDILAKDGQGVEMSLACETKE